jgi:hypothetical protein
MVTTASRFPAATAVEGAATAGADPAFRSRSAGPGPGPAVPEGKLPRKAHLRRYPRHPFRQPVLVIPVLPDGSPDTEHRVSGMTRDLSVEGVGLDLAAVITPPTPALVVVFGGAGVPGRCAGCEVRYQKRLPGGGLRLGGQFAGFAHELLHPKNLTPAFDAHALEFRLGLNEPVLERWAEVGVLAERLWDRVQLCPSCHAVPTFRDGCPQCGSARVTRERLIHHFACAHVGPVAEFERAGGIVCPKCLHRPLVVGTDYEYTAGPFTCLGCRWCDMELEHVAQCLRCGLRFPGHQAYQKDLRVFHADRLDPLAVLPAPGPATTFSDRPAADGCPPLRAD